MTIKEREELEEKVAGILETHQTRAELALVCAQNKTDEELLEWLKVEDEQWLIAREDISVTPTEHELNKAKAVVNIVESMNHDAEEIAIHLVEALPEEDVFEWATGILIDEE